MATSNIFGPPRKVAFKKYAMLTIVFIYILFSLNSANAAISLEHKVKAAYIYKLLKFVTWENNTQTSDIDTPINICVLGTGATTEAIRLLDSKQAYGRVINVIKGYQPGTKNKCDVIFVARSEKNNLSEILLEHGSNNRLTISGIRGFAEFGGMVELAVVENKVKLIINKFSVDKSSIRLSSKLLDIAVLIKNDNKLIGTGKQ